MFNPNHFASRPQPQEPAQSRPSGRIILEKMTDHSKTRWDEPITVPDVLYQKFKLPIPAHHKQPKKYPLSLIDYIKRAYSKCKDEIQARAMEAELRKVIAKHEDALDSVNWQEVSLPSSQEQQRRPSSLTSIREPPLKKQVSQPKEYVQTLGVKQEAPAQTKLKISMTLQKLQEKLSKKQEGKLQPQKKTFIGFSNREPESYQPTIKSEISPHLRTIFANPPPPPPPPPKKEAPKEVQKKQVVDQFSKNKSKQLESKFSRSSIKSQGILNVVTSTQPQPIQRRREGPRSDYFSSAPPAPTTPSFLPSPSKPQQKQKGKIVITRKQLNQISKAVTKPSDVYTVAKRYQSFNKLKPQSLKSMDDLDEDDEDFNEIIIGRNTCIDKPYLRITGRPDPDTVRPEPILKKALSHFLKEHKKGTPYDILISQFKSIRQDLTVQHIRNSFTVEVYEENFKMSLFENDIIQVKHCQANLWELYRQGLSRTIESRDQFISFHFITLILEEKYMELQYMLTLLPEGTLEHPQIQESLKLKKIFLLGNYRAFFDFYNQRDEVCRKLLNIYIDKIRMKCLVMFSKIGGEKMTFKLLGDTVGEDEDVMEALAVGEGAVVRQDCFMLKQSYQKLSKSDFLVIKKVTNLLI